MTISLTKNEVKRLRAAMTWRQTELQQMYIRYRSKITETIDQELQQEIATLQSVERKLRIAETKKKS